VVPLRYRATRFGVVTAVNDASSPAFTQRHMEVLVALANQAAASIENSRLYAQLEQSHAELEERVRERTTELSAANSRLRAEIAERQRVESDLQEERNLFVGGPTVVFRWCNTPGWPVPYVSPNIKALLGYDPEDFVSGLILYADIMHPNDLVRAAAEVDEYCRSGVEYFEQVYRLRHSDGQYRWL
jgi:PAS domain-containing protein